MFRPATDGDEDGLARCLPVMDDDGLGGGLLLPVRDGDVLDGGFGLGGLLLLSHSPSHDQPVLHPEVRPWEETGERRLVWASLYAAGEDRGEDGGVGRVRVAEARSRLAVVVEQSGARDCGGDFWIGARGWGREQRDSCGLG